MSDPDQEILDFIDEEDPLRDASRVDKMVVWWPASAFIEGFSMDRDEDAFMEAVLGVAESGADEVAFYSKQEIMNYDFQTSSPVPASVTEIALREADLIGME